MYKTIFFDDVLNNLKVFKNKNNNFTLLYDKIGMSNRYHKNINNNIFLHRIIINNLSQDKITKFLKAIKKANKKHIMQLIKKYDYTCSCGLD